MSVNIQLVLEMRTHHLGIYFLYQAILSLLDDDMSNVLSDSRLKSKSVWFNGLRSFGFWTEYLLIPKIKKAQSFGF